MHFEKYSRNNDFSTFSMYFFFFSFVASIFYQKVHLKKNKGGKETDLL